ncbi:MAG TPA: hypothetical protein VFC28_02895 [Opitutaceae bacterium]|nr:hypothetical protein [Opitutaceae bacterium]
MPAETALREPPWKAGLRGARANLLPGFLLQVTALVIVLAYYHHAPTRAAFERLTVFRAETGFASGIVSTALFGGLLPFLYLRSNPASCRQYGWRQGLLLTAFWGYKGLEIEVLYRILARVVGEGHNAATIVTKTFLDQFVYCPILAVPLTVVIYKWNAVGFSFRAVADDFRTPGWYGRTVLPTLVANLGVWVPAVAIIYSLPTPLQLPLQNLVLVFFTLLLAHLNERRG